MDLNVRGNLNNTSAQAASRAGTSATQAAQPKKHKFLHALGSIGKVALGVVGTVVPGASVLTNALGSALGGSFGNYLAAGGGFGSSAGMSGAGGSMVSEMAAMNMQFMALQNAVQNESRKYQTISNASKARHDIAMNAIRNIKA